MNSKKHGLDAAKTYCKEIKKHLTCPRKIKKDLIFRVQSDLHTFIDENPSAMLDEIVDRFGDPSELAASYISSLDAFELEKQLKNSKKIRRIVLVVCAIILALIIIMFLKVIHDSKARQTIYITETVTDFGIVSE